MKWKQRSRTQPVGRSNAGMVVRPASRPRMHAPVVRDVSHARISFFYKRLLMVSMDECMYQPRGQEPSIVA